MAKIQNVFDVASRAMNAQITRLNAVASNLANSRTYASTPEQAYKPIKPVFATQYADQFEESGLATVEVERVVPLDRDAEKIYQPDHPKADEDGYVYASAVNVEEEMVDMFEASRQYQNNLEVVSTLRSLMARTANMGR